MYIRIIGAGALGMLTAAYLSKSGAEVELVTRTIEQTRLIREEGLRLTVETDGRGDGREGAVPVKEFTAYPKAISFDEASGGQRSGFSGESPEAILLTVKQTAVTEQLALGIKAQLRPDAKLVCFQNGIGHMELLKRFIPAEQLLTAVTTEGAYKHSPNHAAHTGHGTTWLGKETSDNHCPFENEKSLDKKLQIVLNDAGFSVSLSNNITSKVWNKLLMNSVINPVTAVLQARNGLLPELPASRLLMRSLYDEAALLANKLGIELAPDLWDQLLDVCKRTANNRSSMLQDVLSQRPTEVDAITGGLLKRAGQAGIQLPTHAAMYHLLRSIEQQWDLK